MDNDKKIAIALEVGAIAAVATFAVVRTRIRNKRFTPTIKKHNPIKAVITLANTISA